MDHLRRVDCGLAAIRNWIYIFGGRGFKRTDNTTGGGTLRLGDTWRSTDGISWEKVRLKDGHPNQPPFPASLFVAAESSYRKDIYVAAESSFWKLKSNKHWNLQNASPGWTPRMGFGFCWHAPKRLLVLAGGKLIGQNKVLNDVWISKDGGRKFNIATNSAPWSPRSAFKLVSFGEYIWLLGGEGHTDRASRYNYLSDVWRSSDGVSWEKVTGSARWSARARFATIAFEGALWVAGGEHLGKISQKADQSRDVWRTENGRNWDLVANAPWIERSHCQLIEYRGELWLFGGKSGHHRGVPGNWFTDIWKSRDGKTWTLLLPHRDFKIAAP